MAGGCRRAVTSADLLRAAGTTPAAIEHHYDLSEEFFAGWLGPDLVYSCGWWPEQPGGSLAEAQHAKIDYFATQLGARGRRVLDVGCGWGALLDRWVRRHGAAGGVGLTLSRAQARRAQARAVPGVDYRVASWVDHEPDEPYDLLTCIEATEHFASDAVDADGKVEVYRAFFERAASWLRPGGRVGLQLICLDDVGHEGSRAGRGPLSELIRTEIFPESMPASLSELTLGWEPHFELDSFLDHHDHYRRTFRAWNLAFRSHLDRIRDLVGRPDGPHLPAVLRGRRGVLPAAGALAVPGRADPPPDAEAVAGTAAPERSRRRSGPTASPGASPAAVREHYDVSNDFYALWLDPSMMYTSGMWRAPISERTTGSRPATGRPGRGPQDRLLRPRPPPARAGPGARRRLRLGRRAAATRPGARGRRGGRADRQPGPGRPRRPGPADPGPRSGWSAGRITTRPSRTTGSSASAPSSTSPATGRTAPERVAAYRRFFAACFSWLPPGGRLGLETIAHDGAPDTDAATRARAARRLRARPVPGVDLPAPGRGGARLRAVVPGRGAAQRRRRLRPHLPAVAGPAARARGGRRAAGGARPGQAVPPVPGGVGGAVPHPDDHELPFRPVPARAAARVTGRRPANPGRASPFRAMAGHGGASY